MQRCEIKKRPTGDTRKMFSGDDERTGEIGPHICSKGELP
jgi:hypothetical protein